MRRTILLVASAVAALVIASGVALAALSEVPDKSVQANGRVSVILHKGDKVYLGGSFTRITDTNGTTVARNNLAAIDVNTGRVTDWNPNARNPKGASRVRAMALSSDGKYLYVGGSFTNVGSFARSRLAAVKTATGAVLSGWKADVNKPVYALAVSGSRLYLGGSFTTVAGQPRQQLAAVNTATARLSPDWKPRAYRPDGNSSTVRTLDVSPTNTARVYAGGYFTYISGRPTGKLVALDASSGAVVGVFDPDVRDNILCMDISGGRVFAGADDPLEGIEAFNANNGQRAWVVPGGHPDPAAGAVQAIVVSGTKVYAGGHFTQMGGLVRKRVVEVDAATGEIGSWAPAVAGGHLGVWALETDAVRGQLYAGGDFTKVSGRDQNRFARFSGL